MQEIAPDLAIVPMTIANAYLAGPPDRWVVVDTGAPGSAATIRKAAGERYGSGARPSAILLTHGHFDHAGSAAQLARHWDVRVYVHRWEWPYLTGRSHYPPLDPTGPGFFCGLSRLFPSGTANLSGVLEELPEQGDAPFLEGWQCIPTPGHTPGHVALFRPADGALIAGDAVTTMDLDSLPGTLLRVRKLCRPPVPATFNWGQAQASVERLAALEPSLVAAGHGLPIVQDAAGEMRRLARHFPVPQRCRYVATPVAAGPDGVISIPPAPFDPFPLVASAIAVGVLGAAMAKRSACRKGGQSCN